MNVNIYLYIVKEPLLNKPISEQILITFHNQAKKSTMENNFGDKIFKFRMFNL